LRRTTSIQSKTPASPAGSTRRVPCGGRVAGEERSRDALLRPTLRPIAIAAMTSRFRARRPRPREPRRSRGRLRRRPTPLEHVRLSIRNGSRGITRRAQPGRHLVEPCANRPRRSQSASPTRRPSPGGPAKEESRRCRLTRAHGERTVCVAIGGDTSRSPARRSRRPCPLTSSRESAGRALRNNACSETAVATLQATGDASLSARLG